MKEKLINRNYIMLVPDTMFYMRERDPSSQDNNPFKWVYKTSKDLFAGKNVVIFGLPGAFTPTCSNEQLPGYENLYEEFMEAGVDEVWCTSVNDAFSMFQWAKNLGIKNVKMLPDGNGTFAESLGMLVDKSNLGFGKRSWRYSMLVQDMKITIENVELGFGDLCPIDPFEVSDAQSMLIEVKNAKL
jgi:thioredoxin-dependent peroxiredoxin